MKLFRQLTLLLIGLTAVYSCSKEDYDRDPLLDLSKETLNFTREANAETITVTINDEDEIYTVVNTIGDNTWINAKNVEGGLEIKVEENTTMETRTATIEVLLKKGKLTKQIIVTQAGGGYITASDASEGVVTLSNHEGEKTIYIESNIDWDAAIDGSIPWLTITPADGRLTLKALKNPGEVARTAVIKVTGSGVETVINVIQKGIIYYDFPFLLIGYNYDGEESERGMKYPNSFGDAHQFEIERGSILTQNEKLGLYYNTQSPVFPKVAYGGYSIRGSEPCPTVKIATLLEIPMKPFSLLEDPEFVEYMLNEGFEFAWRNNDTEIATYWDKKRQIAVQFLNYDGPFGNRLTFAHAKTKPNDPEKQTDVFPTFEVIPEANLEFGADIDKIIAWENARGSTIAPSSGTTLVVVPDPAKEPNIIERVYFLDNKTPQTMEYVMLLLNHVDKAYYFTGDMFDRSAYCLTKEFTSLMEQGGYELVQSNPPSHFFYNGTIMYVVYVERYQPEGLLPRLSLQIMPYEM